MKNDVRAAAELALGQLGSRRRIDPGGRGGARHVLDHLDFGIHIGHAGSVTQCKLADERDIHPSHEAHLPGLRSHGRSHSAKKRGFLLPEVDRFHIGQVDQAVDHHELHRGKFLRHGLDRGGLGEAHGHDDAGPAMGEQPHDLFALRRVLDLEFPYGYAGLLLEALDPHAGRLVERLVEFFRRNRR